MGPAVIRRCRELAAFTEEPGSITRTFLAPSMKSVHATVGGWMRVAGMDVTVDAAGNLRGLYRGTGTKRLLIGSHLDTVPNAGAFDGIIGVVMGVALVEALRARKLSFAIEVIGFSEEEGVRFGIPFIGSRALVGTLDRELLDAGIADAIRDYGLRPEEIPAAKMSDDAMGYLEFHIEQGPVLESLNLPLGIVDAIMGQSRFNITFHGAAGHAGTTPMHLRRDALAGAAEWIGQVERVALEISGAATVGKIEARPGAGNVIPESVSASLDVRHFDDQTRRGAVDRILSGALEIAARRGLTVTCEQRLEQASVAMDGGFTEMLARAAGGARRMVSGAGHDAMILAQRIPTAMLFLRSPGGISHHPDESVLPDDVDAALAAGQRFLNLLEASLG